MEKSIAVAVCLTMANETTKANVVRMRNEMVTISPCRSLLTKVYEFAAGPQRLGVVLIYLLRVLNRETPAVTQQ